jgi:hypothetical protein
MALRDVSDHFWKFQRQSGVALFRGLGQERDFAVLFAHIKPFGELAPQLLPFSVNILQRGQPLQWP